MRRRTVAQPPRHHEAPRTQLRRRGRKAPLARPIRAYPPRNPAVFALITASANPADDSLTHKPLPGRRTASNVSVMEQVFELRLTASFAVVVGSHFFAGKWHEVLGRS